MESDTAGHCFTLETRPSLSFWETPHCASFSGHIVCWTPQRWGALGPSLQELSKNGSELASGLSLGPGVGGLERGLHHRAGWTWTRGSESVPITGRGLLGTGQSELPGQVAPPSLPPGGSCELQVNIHIAEGWGRWTTKGEEGWTPAAPTAVVDGHEFCLGKLESHGSTWILRSSLEQDLHTLPLKHTSNLITSPCILLV